MKRLIAASTLALVASLISVPAFADPVTAINISSFYGGANGTESGLWSEQINGSSIAAAPTNGNENTGITFADWTGQYVAIPSATQGSGTNTLTIDNFSPIALTAGASVQSLFSEFYGLTPASADNYAAILVTFTNSEAETATYGLQSGGTIRDYNNGFFYNSLTGTNTTSALGNVTAENWWSNTSGQRLDEQSFLLPSTWAGTSLTGISIDVVGAGNGPNNDGLAVLSALNVDNPSISVPEPSSLALLGTGLVVLGFTLRKRRRIVARK